MNGDPGRWLREALFRLGHFARGKPEPSPAPTTQADSLQALLGAEVPVRERAPLLMDAFGSAHPLLGVAVDPDSPNPRHTRAHEFGHMADFSQLFGEETGGLVEQAGDPEEFADSFAVAFENLQQMLEDADAVPRQAPGDPETINRLMELLLEEEIFRHHPARSR